MLQFVRKPPQHENTILMDTEPGGEAVNQYEEATSFTVPNTDHKANFGDTRPARGEALAQQQKAARERAEQKAENTRFGDAISGHGFGGETTSARSSEEPATQQRAPGRYETDEEAEAREIRDRAKQGYGVGSDVGA